MAVQRPVTVLEAPPLSRPPVQCGTASMRRRPLRRYVPAIPALVAVGTAGAGFERVFTWGDTVGPLLVAVVLGGIAGAIGRLGLAAPGGRRQVPGPGADGSAGAANGTGSADGAGSAGEADPGLAAEAADGLRAMRPSAPPAGLALAALAVGLATLLSPIVTAALFASPGPGGPGAAVSKGVGALFGGWSRILTTSVPVPPTSDRLPLLAGIVALGAALAVITATRRRPGITGLAPAGLVLVAALILGVHGPGSVTTVVAPVAVAGAAYLLLVSRPADDGITWVPPARAVAAVTTGVVVLVVALLIGDNFPLATARHPVDLRSRLSLPLDLGTTPNPLDQVPGRQAQTAGTVMFTASVDDTWLASPTHWRIASLDVYNGAGWTTDARATRAGNQLPAPAGVDPTTVGPRTVARIHLGALGGPWVPTTGLPTDVTPADLSFDPATTTLLSTGPATDFTVTSRLLDPSRASLDTAGLPSTDATAQLTSVPACFPASLRTLAATAVTNQNRPDQQAVAIEQALARGNGFALDPKATPGSSCGRLTTFAKAKTGGAEQYATAFVLMARSVGLPARLAVGFDLGSVDAAGHQTVVHGSDATEWPEVDFAALGWEPFQPYPSSSAKSHGGSGAGATTTVPQLDQGLNQVRQTVAAQAGAPAPQGNHQTGLPGPTSTPGGGFNLLWLIPILLLTGLLGLLAVQVLRRARRRTRRRTAATPAEQIRGAWAEVLDAYGPIAGSRPPALPSTPAPGPVRSLTPSEVRTEVTVACPDAAQAVGEVAAAVDRAVFADEASPEIAAATWRSAGHAVKVLRSAVPPGLRLRLLLVGGTTRTHRARAE